MKGWLGFKPLVVKMMTIPIKKYITSQDSIFTLVTLWGFPYPGVCSGDIGINSNKKFERES